MEMLFTERLAFETAAWKELKAIRKHFLTQQAVTEYLSYIQDYMEKYKYLNSMFQRFTSSQESSSPWKESLSLRQADV
jgi:hypothetical protein